LTSFAAVLAIVFVALALALRGASGTPIDRAVTFWVQQAEHPAFALLMLAVSLPGFWPWNGLFLGALVGGFWAAGLRREALFLSASAGASLLSALAKLLVERPRPASEGVRAFSQVFDYSYPSGHVVGYVSVGGFVFFLVYVLFKRSWRRTAGLIVLGLLVGLVGVSRVYLGHHWASDVLGGYALGSIFLLGLVELYRTTSARPSGGSG
jgi:undecaprenyl-diphosphatase